MKKEYILRVNTWDSSRKKCGEQLYVLNDVMVDDSFFSAGVVMPKIENVIFNGPATIVFWSDDTKTVVKCCEDDEYDPEKGIAIAISKKAMGDCKDIKKWSKKYYEDDFEEFKRIMGPAFENLHHSLHNLSKKFGELNRCLDD